jgi:hypothetical protein
MKNFHPAPNSTMGSHLPPLPLFLDLSQLKKAFFTTSPPFVLWNALENV